MAPPVPPVPSWRVRFPELPGEVLTTIQNRFADVGAAWRVERMSSTGTTYDVGCDHLVLDEILRTAVPGGGWEVVPLPAGAVPPSPVASGAALARALRELAGTLVGLVREPGVPVGPVLRAHEFVAHVVVALDGPLAADDHRYVVELWERCVTRFRLDRPVAGVPDEPRVPLPRVAGDDGVLAARTGAGPGLHQIVLRRLGGVHCVSVLRAPPPEAGVRWAALAEEWAAVLPPPTPGLIGSVQILQARTTAGGLPDPAALVAAVAADSGVTADRWGTGARLRQPPFGPFAVWEDSAGVPGQPAREERSRRRFAVVAPADHERSLSTWSWDNGTMLPPFAQYLRHAATVRYELRVHNASAGVLRRARDDAAAVGTRLGPALRSGRVLDPDAAAAARADLVAARTRCAELAAALRALHAGVDRAAAAMTGYAGADAATGPFAEDARVAARLLARTTTDLGLLDDRLRELRVASAALPPEGVRPAAVEPDGGGLQGLVAASSGQLNPQTLRAGLGIADAVCTVTVVTAHSSTSGTGVLVGPDLLLTCHHVVQEVIDGGASPTGVRCEFGHQVRPDNTVQWGEPYELAEDWLVAFSPHAPGEGGIGSDVCPRPDQLDYALLRLAGRPGGRSPAGRRTPRGWAVLRSAPVVPAVGGELIVLQHPRGGPVKLAMNSRGVRTLGVDGIRLVHDTSTMHGSSGGPCFTFDFELVAVHLGLAGSATANRAVPVAAIVRHLIDAGHRDVLDVVPPVT